MAERYKRIPNVCCALCQRKVYRRPVDLKASKGVAYCSQKCYGMACRKETPCVVCHALIPAHKHAKTCSRSCANMHRTGLTYKAGRLKDIVRSQRSLKLRLIKSRGSACERCRYDKIEIVQVHHKDRNRLHNVLQNLELLCPNCHAEEHYLENSWLSGKVGKHGGVG